MNDVQFRVGDVVSWCGAAGVVCDMDGGSYPVKVRFGSDLCAFTGDGRFYAWHTDASLRLIHRVIRKVKKKMWGVYIDISHGGKPQDFTCAGSLFEDSVAAQLYLERNYPTTGRIAEVALEIEE